MNKLTALFAALLALALMTGPSIAAEMMAGDEPVASSTVTKELRQQLAPIAIDFGFTADGIMSEEYRGVIDTHYGVAPRWEDKVKEPLEGNLRKQLAPIATDFGFHADGISVEEERGVVDTHYGVAPAWEGETGEPLDGLKNQLSPNADKHFEYFVY